MSWRTVVMAPYCFLIFLPLVLLRWIAKKMGWVLIATGRMTFHGTGAFAVHILSLSYLSFHRFEYPAYLQSENVRLLPYESAVKASWRFLPRTFSMLHSTSSTIFGVSIENMTAPTFGSPDVTVSTTWLRFSNVTCIFWLYPSSKLLWQKPIFLLSLFEAWMSALKSSVRPFKHLDPFLQNSRQLDAESGRMIWLDKGFLPCLPQSQQGTWPKCSIWSTSTVISSSISLTLWQKVLIFEMLIVICAAKVPKLGNTTSHNAD